MSLSRSSESSMGRLAVDVSFTIQISSPLTPCASPDSQHSRGAIDVMVVIDSIGIAAEESSQACQEARKQSSLPTKNSTKQNPHR